MNWHYIEQVTASQKFAFKVQNGGWSISHNAYCMPITLSFHPVLWSRCLNRRGVAFTLHCAAALRLTPCMVGGGLPLYHNPQLPWFHTLRYVSLFKSWDGRLRLSPKIIQLFRKLSGNNDVTVGMVGQFLTIMGTCIQWWSLKSTSEPAACTSRFRQITAPPCGECYELCEMNYPVSIMWD